MRLTTKALLSTAVAAGFFFTLNQSLMDMTLADCQRGISAACDQLQRSGIKLPSMD